MLNKISRAAIAGLCTLCVPAFASGGTLSGTVNARIAVTFKSAPPSGSSVSCSVILISSDTLAPSDTRSTSANVSGSSALCVISMHYQWLVASTTSTMAIAYSVSGPSQTSSGTFKVITVPANGTTTAANIAVVQ